MRPFRFRAQAALDLRQREYDDARRVLARATLDLRAADEVRTEADARIVAAREQGTREMRGTIDAARWQWHRSWIVVSSTSGPMCAAASRHGSVMSRGQRRPRRQSAPAGAKSLERFRDKARLAWEHAVAAEEQKQIDELATLRQLRHFGNRRKGAELDSADFRHDRRHDHNADRPITEAGRPAGPRRVPAAADHAAGAPGSDCSRRTTASSSRSWRSSARSSS